MEKISKCPTSHAVNLKLIASSDILIFKVYRGLQPNLGQSLLMAVCTSFGPQLLVSDVKKSKKITSEA